MKIMILLLLTERPDPDSRQNYVSTRPSRSAKTAATIKITTQSTTLQDKDEEFQLLREAEMEEESASMERKAVAKREATQKKEEAEQMYNPSQPTHLVPGEDIAPGILTEIMLCHCNGFLIKNVRMASPLLMRFSPSLKWFIGALSKYIHLCSLVDQSKDLYKKVFRCDTPGFRIMLEQYVHLTSTILFLQ